MVIERAVPCPAPSRSRPGERLLELFLHAWQDGRFAHRLAWRNRGLAVGSDSGGVRVALVHTRRAAPPPEEALAPVAATVPPTARRLALRFHPAFLEKALA